MSNTWIRGAVASALVGFLGWSAYAQEPVGGTAAAANLSKEQVRAIVAEYVKEQADKKSASEADAKRREADQGTVVGADLSP